MARPERPLAGLTVLAVEDSRYSSEALRLLCMRSGARMRRADCLRSANRHLLSYRPDVAIIDLGLPDGDGTELIRYLARATPRLPVIIGLSGDPGSREEVIAAGADGFLSKPLENLAIFQQAILSVLPANMRRWSPIAVPNDLIMPDAASLREDLAHVADIISGITDTSRIAYIARFLEGIARSAHDEALEAAATALVEDHRADRAVATDLARISGMVQDRLTRTAGH
nr:response regulator [Paracoccus methylarcula]